MRHSLLLPAFFLLGLSAGAQEEKPPPRYGFDYNPDLFAQKTPTETLKSIVKAIDTRRVKYLLAQLADPKYVDSQVDTYKGQNAKGTDESQTFLAFDRLVNETIDYFLSDPVLVKELRLFARDAKWDVADDLATGTVKEVPARKVFLRRIGERWFLENRQQ